MEKSLSQSITGTQRSNAVYLRTLKPLAMLKDTERTDFITCFYASKFLETPCSRVLSQR